MIENCIYILFYNFLKPAFDWVESADKGSKWASYIMPQKFEK